MAHLLDTNSIWSLLKEGGGEVGMSLTRTEPSEYFYPYLGLFNFGFGGLFLSDCSTLEPKIFFRPVTLNWQ